MAGVAHPPRFSSGADEATRAERKRYRLGRRLGCGALTEVFVGRHEGYLVDVAIKRLRAQATLDLELVELFADEFRLASVMDHSNVVDVYEFGVCNGSPYYVMEYVSGLDLGRVLETLEDERLVTPARVVVSVGIALAEALSHIHGRGNEYGLKLVHADVTPGNVLVGIDGSVKMGDFGRASAQLAHGIGLRGQSSYQAPKIFRRRHGDARSDIYSLGVLMYELATGAFLYKDELGAALLEKVERRRAPTLSRVQPNCPEALETVVHRCLAPEPGQRYQSAEDLSMALDEVGRQLGSRASMSEVVGFIAGLPVSVKDAARARGTSHPRLIRRSLLAKGRGRH